MCSEFYLFCIFSTALTVVGGIVIIVIAIAIIRCIQKNRIVKEDSNIDMVTIERFLADTVKERPARFTTQNVIDFMQNFAQKLGSGGFRIVYKGQFPNGVQIAVEVLHKTQDKRAD
ncbi:Non-specific serine/threonine protein kinase protein [Dioscorea alata]|uniref:Non-specific serine/threonine protein kinase protein n=1 Tax=Dioscorea alata TaxID=55571 RepID=A0ACB7VKR2_DIOAL|nr:Non-specific serine/threonine protein kinase protein [Dioscorea alata]